MTYLNLSFPPLDGASSFSNVEGSTPCQDSEDPVASFEKRHEQYAKSLPPSSQKAYREQIARCVTSLKNDYQLYGKNWNALSERNRKELQQQIAKFDISLANHGSRMKPSLSERVEAARSLQDFRQRAATAPLSMPRLESSAKRPLWMENLYTLQLEGQCALTTFSAEQRDERLQAAMASNPLAPAIKAGRARLVEDAKSNVSKCMRMPDASLSLCSGPLLKGLTPDETRQVLEKGNKTSRGQNINENLALPATLGKVASAFLGTAAKGLVYAAIGESCAEMSLATGSDHQKCVSQLANAIEGKNPAVNRAVKKAVKESLPSWAIETAKFVMKVDAAVEHFDEEMSHEFDTISGIIHESAHASVAAATFGVGGAAIKIAGAGIKATVQASKSTFRAASKVAKEAVLWPQSITLTSALDPFILRPALVPIRISGGRGMVAEQFSLEGPGYGFRVDYGKSLYKGTDGGEAKNIFSSTHHFEKAPNTAVPEKIHATSQDPKLLISEAPKSTKLIGKEAESSSFKSELELALEGDPLLQTPQKSSLSIQIKSPPASAPEPKISLKQQERVLRDQPLPTLESFPAEMPKHLNEFFHKAQVANFRTKGLNATIFNASFDTPQGPCTLYLYVQNKPLHHANKLNIKGSDLIIAPQMNQIERTNTLLDLIFDRSRCAKHSRAFLVFKDAKTVDVTPIMSVLENRPEKILSKTPYSQGRSEAPMIMLEIELNPKPPLSEARKSAKIIGKEAEPSPYKSEFHELASEVYPLLETSQNSSMSQAIQKKHNEIWKIIPDYSDLGKTPEEIWAIAIDKNGIVNKIKKINGNIQVEFTDGRFFNIKQQEGIGLFNDLMGYDLFPQPPASYFKVPEVVAIGRIDNSIFIATESFQGKSFERLAIGIGKRVKPAQLVKKKYLFNELKGASAYSGKKLAWLHSHPVENPLLLQGGISPKLFKNKVKQTNEALEKFDFEIVIDGTFVEDLCAANNEAFYGTFGVGENISLDQFVLLEKYAIGFLNPGRMSHFTTVSKTPSHCPARGYHAFLSMFDHCIAHGMSVEQASLLKTLFDKAYFSVQTKAFPKAVNDIYQRYYFLDAVEILATKINPENLKLVDELIKFMKKNLPSASSSSENLPFLRSLAPHSVKIEEAVPTIALPDRRIQGKMLVEHERALRDQPFPAIESIPSNMPKDFFEFCNTAHVYECQTADVNAAIFNTTVDSPKGLSTLYLFANERPRYEVCMEKFNDHFLITSVPTLTRLERTNAVLDLIFAHSRSANHSHAYILLKDAKHNVSPILTAFEHRAEKIIGRSPFSRESDNTRTPMIMLEIEL